MENEYNFSIYSMRVSERKYTDDEQINARPLHKSYAVMFCTEGAGIYQIGNEFIRVKKGDCAFFQKETFRNYHAEKGSEWHFIAIPFSIIYHTDDTEKHLDSIQTFFHNAPSTIQNLFKKALHLWNGKSIGYSLICRTIVQEILYEMIKLTKISNIGINQYGIIEDAQTYIQNHMTEKIIMDDLIEKYPLSPAQFRRLFKQYTGFSPNQYYNHIRVQYAKELLLSKVYTVAEVSDVLGFNNAFYFSSIFKKIMGYPPSETSMHDNGPESNIK